MDWIRNHPSEFGIGVAVVVVLLGLVVYGLPDLLRFTPKRIWAVGSVVFRESIRRKILWLTPLAMVGVVILTNLQKPDDGADAIRQSLQFCLFTSGLLVVISGIMLSCTNLPRDIESKVIFTIVTKPITRLEIIAGKIVGFARVTGSILLLMGLFTWAYVHLQAWNLGKAITTQLSTTLDNEFARGRLEHQQREGLLDTRALAESKSLEFLAREPAADSPIRWISTQQSFVIPFSVDSDQLIPQGYHDPAKGEPPPPVAAAGVIIHLRLTADQIGKIERQAPAFQAPLLPTTQDASNPYGEAEFRLSIINPSTDAEIVPSSALNSGKPFQLMPDQRGKDYVIQIEPKAAVALAQLRDWSVVISPANENYLLGMAPGDLSIVVPGKTQEVSPTLRPNKWPGTDQAMLEPRGGSGRSGRMLEGPSENHHSIAVAHYDGPSPVPSGRGDVTLELTMNIDRLDDDASIDATQIDVDVTNRTTGKTSETFHVTPENGRVAYADVPGEFFDGGKFDVKMRVRTQGHAVSLTSTSIAVVQSRSSFALNLLKSAFSQWMLSILVVSVGVLCSTIVSWPIAIVLCVVLLLGRWAVDQVSDSLQPGIGAALATDIGTRDATQARLISAVGDGLARMLNLLAQFLPDIGVFSTGHLLERGLAIPFATLGSALSILLLFGLPVFTLAYIRLRFKEVAP